MIPLRKISSVQALGGFRLSIEWGGSTGSIVDLAEAVAQGGVFSPLSNAALFAGVRVGDRGRTVEWPEPAGEFGEPLIEIDAEALTAMAAEQNASRRRSSARASADAAKLRSAP